MPTNSQPSVETYLAGFSADQRAKLDEIRSLFKAKLPDAQESISYGIPCYTKGKAVVYFAGWKNHVAVYPVPDDPDFRTAAAPYWHEKSSLHLRYDDPLPTDLLQELCRRLFSA